MSRVDFIVTGADGEVPLIGGAELDALPTIGDTFIFKNNVSKASYRVIDVVWYVEQTVDDNDETSATMKISVILSRTR